MFKLFGHICVLTTLLCVGLGAKEESINTGLVNNKVTRTIDLTTHLPKISTSIVLENSGKAPAKSFVIAIEPSLQDKLSYIGAQIKSSDGDKKLVVKETAVANQKGKQFYRVDLAESLDAGKQVTVTVDTVYARSLQPYPAQITQAEKQYVKFVANGYFYSPYKTVKDTAIVNLASSTIESYTKTKPVSASDNTITYGPYENLESYAEGDMVLHYENNSPFLAATDVTRLIEVSHWGNIAVEEVIDIYHTGADLKGSFSRYDYQRNQNGVSSVKAFKTVLPASAKDVYYRDEIGNISTSNLKELDEMVEVELRPRFPLFGGWKTHYVLGYNIPSYQYLFFSGDHYVLKMRFVDHIFDDQVVDQITVKVVLPEGAQDIKLETPYDVERGQDEIMKTYLDTCGRTVVIASKSNLVEQHIQDFVVYYKFSKMNMLQEPLLVVGAFYLLFLSVIIYVRLDFSITKDEATESKMRVAGLIEQIMTIQDRRSALYQSYDDAVNKFKATKDNNAFISNRKNIDTQYKQLTQQITSMMEKLKGQGAEAAEKVSELQRLDKDVREQIQLACTYAEKLVAGKLSKQQYIDSDSASKAKKEDINQKMETILASL